MGRAGVVRCGLGRGGVRKKADGEVRRRRRCGRIRARRGRWSARERGSGRSRGGPPPATPPAAPGVAVTEEKPSQFDDVRFDFDKSEVREDGRQTCRVVADYLKKNPRAKLQIEGHCDERGTAEYNMALGERRATAVMTYLVSLGVSKAALSTVSFGKEKPLDPGHDEEAWAKNRRAHFVLK